MSEITEPRKLRVLEKKQICEISGFHGGFWRRKSSGT